MRTNPFLQCLPALAGDALLLLARLAPAAIFWQSGRTKVDGWQLNDSAIFLFQHEYQVPLLSATSAALLAAIAEHLLPILLMLGLGTRLAALGLLGMTLVIQLFVYPAAWPTHGTWAVVLLLLLSQGPGRLALDHLLSGYWRKRLAAEGVGSSGNGRIEHADPEQCLRTPQ
mgnify:CR=1 FL=1